MRRTYSRPRGCEVLAPAHLLLAVIDHGEPAVVNQLVKVGLDVPELRVKALAIVGAAPDLAPIAERDVTPAGLQGRPPLRIEDLDSRAWRVLRWRQEHLPLNKLRRRRDWDALFSLERQAASRIASRLRLEDSQRYSLGARHGEQVQRLALIAKPLLVVPERPRGLGRLPKPVP